MHQNIIDNYDELPQKNGKTKMDLREYLFRKKIHVSDFAKVVNYSRQHLYGVISGKLRAGKKLADAIEKATEGAVKAKDLLKK